MSKGNVWLTSLMLLTFFFGLALSCGIKRVACLERNVFQFCFRTRSMVFLVGNVKYCPKGTVCDETIGLSPCVKQDNTYEVTTNYPQSEITLSTEIPADIQSTSFSNDYTQNEMAPLTEIPQYITSLSYGIETLPSDYFIDKNVEQSDETIQVKLPNAEYTTSSHVIKVTESSAVEESQTSYDEPNAQVNLQNYTDTLSSDYFIDDNVLEQSDDETIQVVKLSNDQTTASYKATAVEENQIIYEDLSTEQYLNSNFVQYSDDETIQVAKLPNDQTTTPSYVDKATAVEENKIIYEDLSTEQYLNSDFVQYSDDETIQVAKLPTDQTTTPSYVEKATAVEENQIIYEDFNTEQHLNNNFVQYSDDETIQVVKLPNDQTTTPSYVDKTTAVQNQKIYEHLNTKQYSNTRPTTSSIVKTTPCIKYYVIKYRPQISYNMKNKITNFVLNERPENKEVPVSNVDLVLVTDQDKIIVNKPATDYTRPAKIFPTTISQPEAISNKLEIYQTPTTEYFPTTFQYKILLPNTLKTVQTSQTEKATTTVTTHNELIQSKQETVPKCTGRGTYPSSKCHQYYECVQILWWYNLKIRSCGSGRRYDITVLTCVTDVSCNQ